MALPLQQSEPFARALDALGVPIASRAPLIIERRFPILGNVRFASRIAAHALAQRPRIMNAETDTPDLYRAAGYRQIITPAHIARWDIGAPDLEKHMSGKWRNQLRRGLGNRLHIREITWDGSAHWLFDLATKMAKQRRFRALPVPVIAAFAKTTAKSAVIFEAHKDGKPVAACLVLRHGPSATYQTAWSSPDGKTLQASRVLLDHAARRLAGWGHTDFDLGVVDTEHAAGLARFKLGTGAHLVRLGGTWVHMGRARPLAPAASIA